VSCFFNSIFQRPFQTTAPRISALGTDNCILRKKVLGWLQRFFVTSKNVLRQHQKVLRKGFPTFITPAPLKTLLFRPFTPTSYNQELAFKSLERELHFHYHYVKKTKHMDMKG